MSYNVSDAAWLVEGLSSTDRLVLVCLASFASHRDRTCYPSNSAIRERTGLGERTIQGAVKRLAVAGHISVRMNEGKGGANLYRVTPQPPQEMPPAGDAPPQEMRPTPAADAGGPPQEMRTNKVRNKVKNKSSLPKAPQGDFDAFWAVCPRKKAKAAAEKAYEKALQKAPAEVILAGMRRHAEERAGQDPRYTPHPATWLNREQWGDAPEAPSPARSQQNFHDNLERLLRETDDGLPAPDADDHRPPEQLSAPVPTPGPHGRPYGGGGGSQHGGGDQQAHLRVVYPRKFG